MKRLTIIIFLLSILTSSCIQNNGYIGNIFGKWKLIKYSTNHTEKIIDNIYFSFQNDIISVHNISLDYNIPEIFYGNFKEFNDSIYIGNFNYNSGILNSFGFEADNYLKAEVNKRNMIFQKGDTIWVFKKF